MTRPLEGKVALITGSSRGLGAAIATELAEQGATVAVNYRTDAAGADGVVRAVEALGARAQAFGADVGGPEEAAGLVQRVLETFGRTDILVNNAGISRAKTVRRMTVEEWDEVLRTNLSSVFYVTHAALEGMLQQRWGRIVNISSMVGQAGEVGLANYAASKAGMLGFTKSLALEVAKYGVTVNAVCPGYVHTELNAELDEDSWTSLQNRIPLGRAGTAKEVSSAVRYLVVEGDWITGQAISVNGGMYM